MKTRILKALTNNILEDEEIEEKKFINEQIIDKGYDERKEVFNRTVEAIITTPTSEKGGLIAITGFYYQMLVVIEYIIEMIDEILGLNMSLDDKKQIGKSVGADIPYLLVGKTARTRGIGDELESLYK